MRLQCLEQALRIFPGIAYRDSAPATIQFLPEEFVQAIRLNPSQSDSRSGVLGA
jgi:hypothetical protein